MIWISKSFGFGAEWADDQDRFAGLQLAVAAGGGDDYTRMLMALRRDARDRDTVIIGLPHKALTSYFPTYSEFKGRMPASVSLLVGSPIEFEKHFAYACDAV